MCVGGEVVWCDIMQWGWLYLVHISGEGWSIPERMCKREYSIRLHMHEPVYTGAFAVVLCFCMYLAPTCLCDCIEISVISLHASYPCVWIALTAAVLCFFSACAMQPRYPWFIQFPQHRCCVSECDGTHACDCINCCVVLPYIHPFMKLYLLRMLYVHVSPPMHVKISTVTLLLCAYGPVHTVSLTTLLPLHVYAPMHMKILTVTLWYCLDMHM